MLRSSVGSYNYESSSVFSSNVDQNRNESKQQSSTSSLKDLINLKNKMESLVMASSNSGGVYTGE